MRTVGDMPGATFRFPQPIWADDRMGFRKELGKRIDEARGDAGVLDALTLPNAAIAGFPVECFKAGLAKPQSEADLALPTWINYAVAWFVAVKITSAGLGSDAHWGLMETAQVRIYRGTDRAEMARRFARERLDQLREEWRAADKKCNWLGWMQAPMRYASLAANERPEGGGRARPASRDALRGSAVRVLPATTLLRSPKGYAPYDELLRERARRIERIRAELLQLEAEAGKVARHP